MLEDVSDALVQPDLQRAQLARRPAKMRAQRFKAAVQPRQPGRSVVHCEIEEDHNLPP